jgi:hypothetical protein
MSGDGKYAVPELIDPFVSNPQNHHDTAVTRQAVTQCSRH